MGYRLSVFFCIMLIVIVAANPFEQIGLGREKRDVMDSTKNAATEVAKTLNDAGEAVVNVFKPTEKSTIDKIADAVNG
ncbi:unnamed protein product [Arctia plantaginis]|uniref:Uncharacterized protein n=1 Tax=Arctia plantaginis TaxID=874455 RepID=A0A8S1AZH3_ARCPL|nr:unnamed protein product [Arctia plantaginis]